MPIQPIDLQVLFSRINQIGKEQAMQRDLAGIHQSMQGGEFVKKNQELDNSVVQSHDVGDGVEETDEDGENSSEQPGEQKRREKQEEKSSADFVEDPDVGHHIDISG